MSQRYRSTPFRPAWWLPGAHAQTIGGRWLRQASQIPLQRERVELPDGDFVDLDFAFPDGLPDGAEPTAVALVLHGLEGSASSGYMVQTLRELGSRGVLGVGMNFRSCSGEMNRQPRFYHAGDTGDLAHIVQELERRFPAAALGVVGFSLGGNVLLKYLGETGEHARLQAAAAVSVPFDLAAGAGKLEQGMGRVYTSHFMRKLLWKSREKTMVLSARCDLDRVVAARTLREFDDAATAPLHGFRNAEQYYAESSCTAYLAGIRVPTLIVHSVDDPFLPARFVPRHAVEENPVLVGSFTAAGGHVGFVGGSPWAPVFYAEREAAGFLSHHLGRPRGGRYPADTG